MKGEGVPNRSFVFVPITYLLHIHEHGAMCDVGKDGPQRLQIRRDSTLQLLIKCKLCIHDFIDGLTMAERSRSSHSIPTSEFNTGE